MKIPTSVALAIIAAFILIVAGVGYYQISEAERATVAEVEPVIADSLPFRTEEGWTVWQITQFLADLGRFAQDKDQAADPVTVKLDAGAPSPGTYKIRGDHAKAVISVAEGVWKPSSYAAWAKQVFGPADPALPDISAEDLAKALLTPDWDTFVRENARISTFLTAHPASAQGHLQAALLLGTVALNDYAGTFRDVRLPLNRFTAHLAAADALGLPATDPPPAFD